MALDRKTVRGILQAAAWQAYTRPERAATLLAEHASYLQRKGMGADVEAPPRIATDGALPAAWILKGPPSWKYRTAESGKPTVVTARP